MLLGLLIQGGAATKSFPAWDLSRLRYFGVRGIADHVPLHATPCTWALIQEQQCMRLVASDEKQ